MRIRTTDTDVFEVKRFGFTKYGHSDEDGEFVVDGVLINTIDTCDNTDIEFYLGQLDLLEFWKAKIDYEDWYKDICDRLTDAGYWDMRQAIKTGLVELF